MWVELHVLVDSTSLQSFELSEGTHLLGSSAKADLVLPARVAAGDVCLVGVSPDGTVTVYGLGDDDQLEGWDGERGNRLVIENGRFAKARGLELLVLERAAARDIVLEEHPEVPATAPNEGVKAPPREALALMVRVGKHMEVVELEAPQVVFGRGPGCVALSHPEVSRRHAKVVRKPDGFWVEDLGSTHGTFLNGARVTSAAFPVGGRVHLSGAIDAPVLKLVARAEAHAEGSPTEALNAMQGHSPEIERVRAMVLRYGPLEMPVLIHGETGVGKDPVARGLARLRGKAKPYRPVNCAAITDGLFEAHLFGHKKGAFTGAVADAPGQVALAGDGTLFLDEIGELTLVNQAKLLRLLESREYQQVGGSVLLPVRCRIVAATHRDLEAMVREGTFREDLYHRIAVLKIEVAPLRERPSDIPKLAYVGLRKHGGQMANMSLSDGALAKLLAHPWPGNVRELHNVVQRAAANAAGLEISEEEIVFAAQPAARVALLPVQEEALDRARCERALEQTRGNVAGAARQLGVSQSAFRRALIRYDLLPASRGALGIGS